jgi:threonine synthase
VLSTAHPAKFIEVVERATGLSPELPPSLAEAAGKEKKAYKIGNTLADLSKILRQVIH